MKFDLSAAWNDSLHLLRQNSQLLVPLVGIFLFLPALAFALSLPAMAEPPATATSQQVLALMMSYFRDLAPYFFLMGLISLFGNLTILRLFLGDRQSSVGDALKTALVLFLPAIVAQLLSSVTVGIGFMLFIIPGLYLLGRLSVTIAVIAGERQANPITALKRSWEITRDNGWRIVMFIVVIAIVGWLIQAILSGITGLVAALATTPDVALVIVGTLDSLLGALLSAIMICVTAAIYRQLAGHARREIDTVFE